MTTLLSIGLTFPLAPAVVAQGAALGAASAAMREARTSLVALSALLDPAEYDPDALGLELAFEDADTIAAWVSDRVSYQVYPGVLRGPRGTLVAGAGNALDQSVLLAKLLGDAGYDVRVVLGELTPDDALTLVMSMFSDAAESTGGGMSEGSGDLDAAGLERLAAASGIDARELAAAASEVEDIELQDLPAYREAYDQAQVILAALTPAADRLATDALVAEASQYAWVEHRLGEGSPWEAAHPAWPVEGAAPDAVRTHELDGEVPQELLHRLRVEVTIERKRGDAFETAPLMTPWQRPVANLLGFPMVVGNTALDAGGAADLGAMGVEMAESAFYAPVLNGALAPGAMAFDLDGNLVPPDVAMSSMAGVFQTTSQRLGDAIGALGAMGTDDPVEEAFALTAQWIDFVLVAPGGEETRHRRTVFDRRSPEARAAGTAQLLDESALLENLISTYVVMATGGALSTEFVASRLYEEAQFHLDVMDSLVGLRATDDDVDESVALLDALGEYVPQDHLRLFASSDAIDTTLAGVAYRAEPSVIALVGTMTPTERPRISSGVDIIANAKRTLHVVDGEVYYDVAGGVLAGTWDTVIEREFAESKTVGSGMLDNAMMPTRPTDWTLLRPDADLGDTGAALPEHAVTAVRRELANGYNVLVPASGALSGGGAPQVWSHWRVDPLTGESLGMNSEGRGAAMAEFVIGLKVGLVVNTALAIPGIAQCMGSGASWLCYCDVIAFGAGMTLAGALFSAFVVAQGALAAYAIIDIGVVGPVTTAIWTPPVCSGLAGSGMMRRAGLTAGSVCWAA